METKASLCKAPKKLDGTNVPIINAWGIYNKKELQKVIENRELSLIYGAVSSKCDLHCIYCQTKSGAARPDELTLEERKDLLRQAKDLCCKFVHIASSGEPTVDPLFPEQLDYINELGMIPLVYTHGANIDKEWTERFWRTNSSIMLKIHSLNSELQDFFAATKGYTERRDLGIKNLIERGFNQDVDSKTRLGADILVMKKNYDEIPTIFRWCRNNNIFPLVKPLLCNNKGASRFVLNNLYVEPLRIKELYEQLSDIDRKEYGYNWKPMPPYAGINCNYYYYHLCTTIMGAIWPCLGMPELEIGNIRNITLEEAWESPQAERIRNIKTELKGVCNTCENLADCYGCPCRRTYNQGFQNAFKVERCWEDNL